MGFIDEPHNIHDTELALLVLGVFDDESIQDDGDLECDVLDVQEIPIAGEAHLNVDVTDSKRVGLVHELEDELISFEIQVLLILTVFRVEVECNVLLVPNIGVVEVEFLQIVVSYDVHTDQYANLALE